MKKLFKKQQNKQHGPLYGLFTVVAASAVFLCFLAVLTIVVRFVMS